MAYYPKSQIKPNLYTNGDEFTLSPNQNNNPPSYIGYYYETSNGSLFTGKIPSDGPNKRLYKIQPLQYENAPNDLITDIPTLIVYNRFSNEAYRTLRNTDLNSKREIPQPNPKIPTDQEILLGVYTRYFCKKNNELKYMEIDKTTFDKLSSKSQDIAWDLYTPISTLWYLRRDSNPYQINKGLISQIEQKQGWYGFTQWFKERF